MWKYYAFKTIGPVVARMPLKVSYFIAHIVGYIIYLVSHSQRRCVKNNIEHVLGKEADKKLVNKTVYAVFRNLAKNYVDLVRLPRIKVKDLEKNGTIHGLNYFEDALNSGKGVILATGHLGNFELVAQMMVARSVKARILVEPLQPAAVFRHVTRLRESQGLKLVPADMGGLKESVQSLRRGEVVVVVCDRDIQGNGMKMKFFGDETTLPSGAVALSLRTNAPIVPVFTTRGNNGLFNVHIEQPLTPLSAETRQTSLETNLERLVAVIEDYIRQYPDQWAVLQPVWQRTLNN
jgi:KDO2-lipid IV(A) lauroyltransferase